MTSDAKLGLLLGLGLVVAIVFAVNGLPGLIFEKVSSTVTSLTRADYLTSERNQRRTKNTEEVLNDQQGHTGRKTRKGS